MRVNLYGLVLLLDLYFKSWCHVQSSPEPCNTMPTVVASDSDERNHLKKTENNNAVTSEHMNSEKSGSTKVQANLMANGMVPDEKPSADLEIVEHHEPSSSTQMKSSYPKNLKILTSNDQIKELQTILRDRSTCRSDFIFYADRLIRLVVEEGLNQLPFDECTVLTPAGGTYKGLKFRRGICGVSIVRSGEAMEKGLRECCRSIRIGKILITTDEETSEPKVCYVRFPPDIQTRKVLLMYPLLNSGATVVTGLNQLFGNGVPEENIIILTLFATPLGIQSVLGTYPRVTLLTTEIHDDVTIRFGKKYFGTD